MTEKSDNKGKMALKDEDEMMPLYQAGWGSRERGWRRCLASTFRLRDLDLISFAILGNHTACARQSKVQV